MTKEEKILQSLEKLNASSIYGSFAKPTLQDEIKDHLDNYSSKYDYLSEAAKDILNGTDDSASDRVKTKDDKNKMCLIIMCMANKNYCMINTIKFKNINTGDIVTIDRDRTEYTSIEVPDTIGMVTYSRYSLHMLWIDCYIWDGTTKNYDVNFDELEFVEFEIEDEAGADYILDLMEYESAPHITS